MSIARSTPAQNPRGPARRISEIGTVLTRSSWEVKRKAAHDDAGFEATVGLTGIAVRDVLIAIACVQRRLVGNEHRRPDAAEEQERECRSDLGDVEVGAARGSGELHIRHETAEREEVVTPNGAQARPERLLGRRVVLIERLETDLQRSVPEVTTAQRLERQQTEASADVVELQPGHAALVLEIELPAIRALGGNHERALLERFLGIEGARGRHRCQKQRERGGDPANPLRHGSIRTFNASPFCIKSSAAWTPSSRTRWVTSPSGVTAPDSSASTACRMSSGVWWNAPTSVSSS